jgi:hypothetical protein
MLFAEIAASATLDSKVFQQRYPHPILISAVGDDDQANNFDTPSKGSSIAGFKKHERTEAIDRTPHNAHEATTEEDEETLSREGSSGGGGLLGACAPGQEPGDGEVPEASGVTALVKVKSDRLLCYPIAKSNRNPFAQMITLGRTPNNDIVLRDSSISKFHAYFTRRGEAWWLHDQGSTNGTFVGKNRIDGTGSLLENGSRVAFGSRLRYRFYTPTGLYEVLTGRPIS